MLVFYQRFISILTPPSCRFYPSCSEYGLQCLDKYSTAKAVVKTAKRICRCHPFHPGGVDLP